MKIHHRRRNEEICNRSQGLGFRVEGLGLGLGLRGNMQKYATGVHCPHAQNESVSPSIKRELCICHHKRNECIATMHEQVSRVRIRITVMHETRALTRRSLCPDPNANPKSKPNPNPNPKRNLTTINMLNLTMINRHPCYIFPPHRFP